MSRSREFSTGIISVASNIVPSMLKSLTKHALAGNFAEARRVHHKLFPLIKSLFLDGNPGGIKYAMKVAGKDTGEMRLPLWEANDAAKKAIEEQVRKFL